MPRTHKRKQSSRAVTLAVLIFKKRIRRLVRKKLTILLITLSNKRKKKVRVYNVRNRMKRDLVNTAPRTSIIKNSISSKKKKKIMFA